MSEGDNSRGPQKFNTCCTPRPQTLSENAGTRLRLFSRGALGKQIQADRQELFWALRFSPPAERVAQSYHLAAVACIGEMTGFWK